MSAHIRIHSEPGGGLFYARCRFKDRTKLSAAGFVWNKQQKRWETGDPRIAAKFIKYAASPADTAAIREATQAVLDSLHSSSAVDTDFRPPAPAGKQYRAYQRAGIEYAMRRPGTIIADEMGLGKTIQSAGVLNCMDAALPPDGTPGPVLVVCPASVKFGWRDELNEWLVRKDRHVHVVYGNDFRSGPGLVTVMNYELLDRHKRAIKRTPWTLVVFDECHKIKNRSAKRTKVAVRIKAEKRLFLSGTPIFAHPEEIYTSLKACNPDYWERYTKFVWRYCKPYVDQWGHLQVSGASNLDELQERMRRTCLLRRLKKDVAKELPEKQRQVVVLDLPENEAAKIRALETGADAPMGYEETLRSLKFQGLGQDEHISSIRKEVGVAKTPAAIKFLKEQIEVTGGKEKIVVFAYHKDVLRALESAFKKGMAARVDGSVTGEKREAAVRKFLDDPACLLFLGQLTAAGAGLNLQKAASRVVVVEQDWTPGTLEQAEDRIHRIGMRSHYALYQYLVIDNTLDAHMGRRLVEKKRIVTKALDKQNLGGGGAKHGEDGAGLRGPGSKEAHAFDGKGCAVDRESHQASHDE